MDVLSWCERYAEGIRETWAKVSRPDMVRVVEAIVAAYRGGRKVITMGNGGMAATASHAVADLVKHPFVSAAKDTVSVAGPRLQAICLTDNPGTLTSWANDVKFEDVFCEQLETWAGEGDVVIAFTTSGNSENLLRAFATARRRGAVTVAVTGARGGKIAALADVLLRVPSDDGSFIEDVQMGLSHIWCTWLKATLQEGAGGR